jgi:hypothetical protein
LHIIGMAIMGIIMPPPIGIIPPIGIGMPPIGIPPIGIGIIMGIIIGIPPAGAGLIPPAIIGIAFIGVIARSSAQPARLAASAT